MRLHVFQHVAFEGAGTIAIWAERAGHELSITRFDQPGWHIPSPDDYDLLVVMGGPMSVADDTLYPWLLQEKDAIRQAIAAGRKVLGICLGAQLAAHVLGANVRSNAHREIGWFPVMRSSGVHPLLRLLPEPAMVFHWHGDAFDVPADAIPLLYSQACRNQAFIWRSQVLGLQFHLELRPEDIELLLLNGADEIRQGGNFVQTAEDIRRGTPQSKPLEAVMCDILEQFMAMH